MTILIAPDKFKGSLSAQEVANAIAEALLSINPNITCIKLPLADGGDGTCLLLTQATHGTLQSCAARDPLLRPIQTHYGLTQIPRSHSEFTAIIEMAAASGLSPSTSRVQSPHNIIRRHRRYNTPRRYPLQRHLAYPWHRRHGHE